MTVSSTRPAPEPPAPTAPTRCHGPSPAPAPPVTGPASGNTTAPTPTAPTPTAPAPGTAAAARRPVTEPAGTGTPVPAPGALASPAPGAAGSDGVPAAPGAGAYRRLGEVVPEVRVRCAPPRSGRGWIAGAELVADPAALRELVAHEARQGLARYGRALRPDVAAGIGLHRFAWAASLLFTLPWFLERRVPLLTPADVSVRRRSGELTVRPGAFVGLRGGPPAGAASTGTASAGAARAVPDETALAAELRAALAGFLTPVLTAFRPEVRRGPRVLWAMATDAVVEGLWYVGGLLGEEERARAELTALFAADGPGAPECAPFTPGAGFTTPASGSLPHTERPERCRASCCLVYTARIEAMCAGCPRLARG
ncbi:(2Fe-2S)-binding protein [Kitasatospora sp. NPDC057500]|uniref:(2Fe-2S)-binding protein n=1 Tax=Kitasatospora sp. NPDC057500 TaxID=3346151 RepID=UPI0036AC3959